MASSSPQTPLTRRAPTGTLITDVGQSTFYAKENPSRSVSVRLRPPRGTPTSSSLSSSCSVDGTLRQHASLPRDGRRFLSSAASDSRFPRLQDCAHFHYERVGLSRLQVSLYQGATASLVSSTECCLSDDNKCLANNSSDATSSALRWASRAVYHGVDEASGELFFTLSVSCNAKHWLIRRSWPHLLKFDKQLHTCCYDRGFSQLTPLTSLGAGRPDGGRETIEALKGPLSAYLARFSQIAGNLINCAPVLSWLELDNRGFHLVACASDGSAINTPAVAAVHVVKRYVPQLDDELALEVGDMISVIDMPAGEESMWWRGKKELEVGFFPGDCVQLISRDKLPHSTPDARRCVTSLSHEQLPVLRKQSKFASFFRSFLSNRPTRRRLKESGILRERIFGCDLGEYLMNASSGGAEGVGLKVPAVLIHCAAFIEQYGIIDGIYRLSGIQSNIHRLRQEFDADHVPDLANSELYMQDIHSVASVLKLYFRELPNPLLTHQLYEQFVEAVQAAEELRLLKIHDVVSRLPPPHYRTLEYLMRHLARIASAAGRTGMTSKNLAIVWAPNLLRSSESESSLDALKGVSVCAIAVEYLVNYAELIFSSQMQTPALLSRSGLSGLSGRPKSLAVSNPAKLLTLDQARSATRANPLLETLPAFVEVGAGPHNLPQFHTVIELPKSRGKRRSRSVKDRKTSLTWRSILPGQRSQRKQVCSDRFLPLSLHSPPGTSQLDSRLSSSRSVESVFQVARSAPDPLLLHSTLPEEPVSAPVHPPLTRSHSSPVSHSRSVSHESYFVRSGSLGLTRPRRIIDVVRTVRYDQCEGGLLVKLSFDEAVENAMQVEAGILNETLVAPATPVEVRADVVEPVPVRQAARVTSKRPYRALSPLVLRRHRSWVAEESKQEKIAKGRFVKATTFPRQTSGIKRCLSASPKTGRRVEVERDAVSLVLGKRASDSCSSSSSSGRKSFRRSAAEEDTDSHVAAEAAAPVSVVVAVVHHQEQQQEQHDIEEACQAICDSYPGQMDAETAVTPSAPYLEDVEDAADVATTPEIAATFVWLDDNAECSSLSSASSSSSLNLLDAEDADKAEGEEESVVPTPSLFLFGLPSRPELCRTTSVPVGSGADEAAASEPVSVKRHSYFFGQSDADWVKKDLVEAKQDEQRILEAEEVRASYLFSQPIADLGASSSRVYTPVAASSLAETLEEIAKQLPSLQPLPDTENPEMDDKTHHEVENEATEVSSNIQVDGYRWMDSSSESLAAPTSDTDAALEPTAEPRSDGKTDDETTENVPDTPCSVRALRCRFEADRKPEPVPKAPGVTLVRSPTRESLKSKLDALSDVYSSESTEADEPVAWHAPLPFSRKWSVPPPVPIKSEGSTGFRWPPEREEPNEEKERKEDGKENSDTVSLSEEGGAGAGSGGRKGKKVSQMCQIFQTPEAVATPSRSGTLTARGTSGRAALSSSSVRLLPQYYSSV